MKIGNFMRANLHLTKRIDVCFLFQLETLVGRRFEVERGRDWFEREELHRRFSLAVEDVHVALDVADEVHPHLQIAFRSSRQAKGLFSPIGCCKCPFEDFDGGGPIL